MPFLIVLLVLLAIALIILISNIAIVPQAYVYVLERMGVYFGTWDGGLPHESAIYRRAWPKRFQPERAGGGL